MPYLSSLLVSVLATALPQDDGAVVQDSEDTITVRGARIAGQAIGEIKPDISITEDEIASYGVSSFEDLLAVLEPVTGSGRGRSGGGRPVILLNGIRIGSFREIRRYPPEALQRVDILPEDTAVRYGYRADQRVVNFVLKPNFQAISGEIERAGPEAGGRQSTEVELGWLRFFENGRSSVDGEFTQSERLLERERNIMRDDPSIPFSQAGNLGGAAFGDEIDPALSTLAGQPLTVAGLPDGAGSFTLSDFLGTANPSDDERPFRTLLPDRDLLELGTVHSRRIRDNVTMTLSGAVEWEASDALLGFADITLDVPATHPLSPFNSDVQVYRYLPSDMVLTRGSERLESELAATFNGLVGPWRYDLIANYSRTANTTETDREVDSSALAAQIWAGDSSVDPFGPLDDRVALSRDRTEAVTNSTSVDGTLTGQFGDFPAGPASITLRARLRALGLETLTERDASSEKVDLSRDTARLRANVAMPLFDRDGPGPSALGDLSFDLRGEVEHYSDVGTLSTYGAGLRWSPVEPVTFSASWRTEDGAPSIGQLGNPLLETPNARIFDFTTGETVEISRLTGGNRGLVDDTRDVFALGVRADLKKNPDITLQSDYTDERIDNPIASFPTLTPEIEAAFADRVERVDGELVFVDARPINFALQTRRELRTTLSVRQRLSAPGGSRGGAPARGEGGSGRPPGASAAGARPEGRRPQGDRPSGAEGRPPNRDARAPSGQGRPGGSSSRGAGRGAFSRSGGGFFSANLTHILTLEDEVLIREGVPVLDYLGGSASGSFGGQAEHQIQSRVFMVRNGAGFRTSLNWESGTRVNGDTAADQLRFDDYSTVDARFFISFDRRKGFIEKYPLFKGTRLAFDIDNIFDTRREVTAADGSTPINYQPDLIDPLGRSFEISLRRLFY